MRRLPTIALILPLAAAGCADLGLDGNIPLDDATAAAPSELVAAAHAAPVTPTDDVVVDGRLWVPWGRPAEKRPDALRPVGSAGGVTVYAHAWDAAPLETLFTRTESGAWQPYAPVHGSAGGS